MEDCLEEVGDIWLVGVMKVNAIYAEIDAGSVDDVGCVVVIMMQDSQSGAGEGVYLVIVWVS